VTPCGRKVAIMAVLSEIFVGGSAFLVAQDIPWLISRCKSSAWLERRVDVQI